MSPVPSTWFTAPPHWEWLVIGYFFVGGLAGGSYLVASLVDLFGPLTDRPVARLGYYVALPSVMLGALCLTLDLGKPLRFWHMLLKSQTGAPIVKPWSPMSLGSWVLLVFGGFALLGVLGALAESGSPRWRSFARLRPPGVLGSVVVALGALPALFVSGYTGVLLSVTNRPIWSDTPVLGLTFLVSAASTSGALLLLLGARRVAGASLRRLRRFDVGMLLFELVAVVALVASLGAARQLWMNHWGVLFVVFVVLLGDLVPLALHWRSDAVGRWPGQAAAVLVLVGGLVLRIVVVLSAQAA